MNGDGKDGKTVPTKIVVYHLPDRAKPCLCLQQGGQVTVLATFRNKNCEELFVSS